MPRAHKDIWERKGTGREEAGPRKWEKKESGRGAKTRLSSFSWLSYNY
jgi:hypothetical protein